MKTISSRILFIAVLFSFSNFLSAQVELDIDFEKISSASKSTLRFSDPNAEHEFNLIDLPMPNGEVVEFALKHSPLSKSDNPLINGTAGRAYTIHSPTEAGYNGAFVMYDNGIHATLNTPEGLLYIERSDINSKLPLHTYTYLKDTEGFIHNPNDAIKSHLNIDDITKSHSHGEGKKEHLHEMPKLLQANNNFFTIGSGNVRKTVDLFILSDKSFLDQYGGNVTNATNRVIEVVNGVRAVWEQDFNLTINYMGVYFNSTEVQAGNTGANTIWNNVSDSDVSGGTKADVDLAHFFAGNGGGGAAFLWVACGGSKHRGYSASGNVASSSYPSLVAHEMAHQMGADHTWTGSAGFCSFDQWGKNSGVEPGAGITLAGYNGICGSDNIPGAATGNYHHLESLREVVIYAQSGLGKNFSTTTITSAGQIPAYGVNYGSPTCLTNSTFVNNVPVANANADNITNFNIPARTPFELKGSATDGDSDPISYQWDELDFALAQQPLDGYATRADGPLFRSYGPSNSTTRIFPKLNDILSNTQVKGEILPETNRPMRFAFIARDGKGGVGVDTIGLNVIDNGAAFAITSQNSGGSLSGSVTVTWNVSGTNNAPISCANVDILLSTDGGQTFNTTLADDVTNDGSHQITLPNINSSTARLKIKCSDNVFFDINNANFTISPSATNCNITSITAGTQSSCNPATNTYSQDITINFTDPPASGMLEVNGQQFAFSGTSQTVTLTNLTADGNAVNVTASFTADSGCSNTANALFSAPANCITCSISNITVGTQSSCNTSNNTYTQELSVTYANSIGSGTLTVNGQQFPINSTSGTETITLTNLMSDGNAVNISANISTSPTCTYSANAAFTAPSACLVCQTFTSANTPVNIADNTSTTDIINITQTGSIADINVVNLNGTHNWINDLSFSLTGPDGTSINLRDRDCGSDADFNLSLDDAASTAIPCPPTGGGTHQPVGSLASFNGKDPQGDWTLTIVDNDPIITGTLNGWGLEVCGIQQQLPCEVSNLSAGSTTDCSAAGDNYTKEIVVTYANPPSTGTIDVNGQNFTITSSPQTVELANLSSDGMAVDVTAAFSTDAGCNRTENALFTAPTFCILCNHNQNEITGSISDSTFISQLTLESDANVTSGSVLYRSPISIELENDFQVTGGALFEAQIGDCIND